MKRRIAPFILIAACVVLGGMAFMRLQANTPRQPPGGFLPGGDVRDLVPASDGLRNQAIVAIMGQLNAFRSGDYDRALAYESHMLGDSLGSPDQFHQLVAGTFPEVAYYKSVDFGRAVTDSQQERVFLYARVRGADNQIFRAFYMLVRDDDGVYRIYWIRGSRFNGNGFGFGDGQGRR